MVFRSLDPTYLALKLLPTWAISFCLNLSISKLCIGCRQTLRPCSNSQHFTESTMSYILPHLNPADIHLLVWEAGLEPVCTGPGQKVGVLQQLPKPLLSPDPPNPQLQGCRWGKEGAGKGRELLAAGWPELRGRGEGKWSPLTSRAFHSYPSWGIGGS